MFAKLLHNGQPEGEWRERYRMNIKVYGDRRLMSLLKVANSLYLEARPRFTLKGSTR